MPGERLDLGAGGGEAEGRPEQRPLQRDEPEPRGPGDDQRPQQSRRDLGLVALALRLGDEAGGAHPQKAEDPVERGEDHRAEPHRPDRGGGADLPDHRGVDRAEDRHSGIRQHDRRGDLQDPRVADLSHAAARASGNARWPARKDGCGCPARPRHAPRHSAGPSGSPAPAHRRRAAGPSAGNRR
ncbi:hypothetical protein SDC9_59529 [bioreactor metagenome]|uniref:Uncharacterized protein n=1 Tax=bioreactor metagenome TaxID=1076179 RepID=A0A644XGD3_9ZZZZ